MDRCPVRWRLAVSCRSAGSAPKNAKIGPPPKLFSARRCKPAASIPRPGGISRKRYGIKGSERKAIEQLDEAIRLAGDDERLYVRAAEMHLAMGDISGASEKVGVAIDLNPQSAAAWALQGQILQQRKQPREALAAYYRALGTRRKTARCCWRWPRPIGR